MHTRPITPALLLALLLAQSAASHAAKPGSDTTKLDIT